MALFIVVNIEVKKVPNLNGPITVTDAWAMADGGSAGVTIQDSNGKKFTMSTKGDLETPKEEFSFYYINYNLIVPIPYSPSVGGEQEKVLIESLEEWESELVEENRLHINAFSQFLKHRNRENDS